MAHCLVSFLNDLYKFTRTRCVMVLSSVNAHLWVMRYIMISPICVNPDQRPAPWKAYDSSCMLIMYSPCLATICVGVFSKGGFHCYFSCIIIMFMIFTFLYLSYLFCNSVSCLHNYVFVTHYKNGASISILWTWFPGNSQKTLLILRYVEMVFVGFILNLVDTNSW